MRKTMTAIGLMLGLAACDPQTPAQEEQGLDDAYGNVEEGEGYDDPVAQDITVPGGAAESGEASPTPTPSPSTPPTPMETPEQDGEPM